jgi:Flp pilus assembly pilin Flp
MNQFTDRFRRATTQTALVRDDRGLSTVEYVIILVLIAAAAVGTWTTFGTTIRTKIDDSQKAIDGANVDNNASNNASAPGKSPD